MEDYQSEIYNKIVEQIINQDLNKIESRNALASMLEKYSVKLVEIDPARYDLKQNIKRYITDKDRQGLSPKTLESYRMHLRIFSKFTNKKIQNIKCK